MSDITRAAMGEKIVSFIEDKKKENKRNKRVLRVLDEIEQKVRYEADL